MKFWFTTLIVITLFAGLAYASVQQVLRMGANDPQIQLSEDMANKLSAGQHVDSFIPQDKIDIQKSLSPFIIVYDEQGKEVFSSATLNGRTPELPQGVLAYAGQHGEDRLTWQPQKKVRIAAVIRHFSGKTSGFILAGRSLREVEIRRW